MNRPQRLARIQESRSAAYYDAVLTPASGSGDSKGDARTATELFEFKHTERQSFGLRLIDFMRHSTEAVMSGRRPVMEIEYTDPTGLHPHYLVVLARDDYVALRDRVRELEEEVNFAAGAEVY